VACRPERAEEARASRLRRFRELLGDLAGLAGDEALDAAELRSRLNALIARFEPERETTQVTAIRPRTRTQIQTWPGF